MDGYEAIKAKDELASIYLSIGDNISALLFMSSPKSNPMEDLDVLETSLDEMKNHVAKLREWYKI